MNHSTRGDQRVGSLSKANLFEIVSLSSQGILVVDAASAEIEILFANPAYAEISGYAAEELAGSSWLSYSAAGEESPELVGLKQSVACTEPLSLSLPFLHKGGDIWLGNFRLTPLESAADDRQLVLVEHIGEQPADAGGVELLKRALSRAQTKITSLDSADPVTGLMSKAQFELMLRRDIAAARREDQPLQLMLFSIPELEIYRSTFGDKAADSCLRMIGVQIAGTFRRASDLSACVDKSTFAVAVVGQDQEQACQRIAQVEENVQNLGLHNPHGRLGRYVIAHGILVSAKPGHEDVEALMARGVTALDARLDLPSQSAAGLV